MKLIYMNIELFFCITSFCNDSYRRCVARGSVFPGIIFNGLRKSLRLLLLTAAIIICGCSYSQNINKTNTPDRVLKDVYKDAFLIGTAVTQAITSGSDKSSQ